MKAKNGKKICRLAALKAREAIRSDLRIRWEEEACRYLSELAEVEQAKTILSYMARGDELSLRGFHIRAAERGKRLAFPVSRSNGHMEARIPISSKCLRTGLFGIMEPEPACSEFASPEEIDLIIVPCVAFDELGNRLGYGRGYYDRYLPQCTHAVKMMAAFEAQRVSEIIPEAHDVSLDLIVTEVGVRRVKRA